MVVGTEAKATDEVSQRKQNTTVAMDYGILNLADGGKLHLYGTPGQDRFDFMWEILSENAMGLVILIDSARPDPVSDLKHYLTAFSKSIAQCQEMLVIGVTRTEINPQLDLLDKLRAEILNHKLNIPVLEIDGRERNDVKQLLLALLALLDPSTSRNRLS